MSGAMLGSRRIRCGWAQHKQETSSASYVAVDQVRTSVSVSVIASLSRLMSLQSIIAMLIVTCCPARRLTRRMQMST